jgi:hypothetical protein
MNNYNNSHLVTFESVCEDQVSCFKSVKSIHASSIKIIDWIKYCVNPIGLKIKVARDNVLLYRATLERDLKLGLPAFCPGALLKSRDRNLKKEEKIISQTGWMQFDIDLKDNPTILDAPKLRDQIKNIRYVAFCGLSVSGKGVWGLVKVLNVKNYSRHFKQLVIDFKQRGIILDESKGGNPTDLRIYSYDPDAYIANSFLIYDRKFIAAKPRKYKADRFDSDSKNSTESQSESLVNEILLKSIDLAPDYETYIRLGFAFANELGETGRGVFHKVCCISPKYKEVDADKFYSSCLKSNDGRTTIATFFHLCKEAGLSKK